MDQRPSGIRPGPEAAARAAVDRELARLAGRKEAWVQVGIAERIALLESCIKGIARVSDEWVREACVHRGIDPGSALSGEEWISGPMTTVRNLQLLVEALRQNGQPRPPAFGRGPEGQTVARVFPRNALDRFLFYNMTAEVWIEPGHAPTQGSIYREKAAGRYPPARLALVLGAGNVSSIGPLDVAYKLFVEDQVVLLKMHPVNAYLGPLFERALSSLIDEGFLGVAYGGADVGQYLCTHSAVDTIHLTGSDRTYDAIVWGGDSEEQARRKAADRPVVDKPFTAELGCVTPVLVVPGRWTPAQIDFQARQVASTVAHNASFNCNAGKVLVTASGWDQRERFIERVQQALSRVPARRAYYPGAAERYQSILEHYPKSIVLGAEGDGVVPWTWIPDVPPRAGEYALSTEPFCGVLSGVQLEAAGATEFLERAVNFANEALWGTLSCMVLIDPPTSKTHRGPLEHAISRLRYGNIGINVWTGVSFGLGVTSWGAFPGHTRESIVSGAGVVHNAFLFDHPQKSVLRAPLTIWPKPVWFADHRNLHTLGRHLTRFEAHRSPWHLARVALAGLRA